MNCHVPRSKVENNSLKEFGANVRRARVGCEMTQEQLAERVELNLLTVQKIEAGETNLLLTTVMRIQRALRVPWIQLISEK